MLTASPRSDDGVVLRIASRRLETGHVVRRRVGSRGRGGMEWRGGDNHRGRGFAGSLFGRNRGRFV